MKKIIPYGFIQVGAGRYRHEETYKGVEKTNKMQSAFHQFFRSIKKI
jgi:predicted transcriptional regulator